MYQSLKYKRRNSMRNRGVGTPINYTHKWRYNGGWIERKIAPRTWRFRFVATKTRGGSSRGGIPVGGKMIWKLNGIQTAKKIGGRTYITDFRGIKKQLGYSLDGRKINWTRQNKNKRYY